MGNMGYCRFENTSNDLTDCYDHWDDQDLNEFEEKARARILRLCQKIVSDYGEDG